MGYAIVVQRRLPAAQVISLCHYCIFNNSSACNSLMYPLYHTSERSECLFLVVLFNNSWPSWVWCQVSIVTDFHALQLPSSISVHYLKFKCCYIGTTFTLWNILSRVRRSVTNNNEFWIAWLGLLTLLLQAIQRCRWFTQFTAHRYTCTSILSLI
jgi:hypothetical protein